MFRPGTDNLPLYPMGEEPAWLNKLDANERPGLLPPAIRNEISSRLRRIESTRYPDMGAPQLRQLLADAYHVTAEQVLVGNGSSELIATACATFGGPGRAVVYQWPSFSMYPIYAAMAESPAIAAPLGNDFTLSPAVVLETVRQANAKLLILCNPNNPTGNAIPPETVREILEQSPCPVLVDEAYMEFYGESCTPWLAEFPRLMVARTFSKAYGLAAARVGYLLAAPELCAAIGKRLLPYHSNAYSLALAEICFSRQEEVLNALYYIILRRDRMAEQIKKLATIEVFPSAANFLLIRVAQPAALHNIFKEHGVGIRNFSYVPELAGCLRITVGSPEDNRQAMQCLRVYNARLAKEEILSNE